MNYLKIGALIAAVVCLLSIGYHFGYESREKLALEQANAEYKQHQKEVERVRLESINAQKRLSESESEAWGKYNDAQKNYDDAVADGNTWRVRLKSCQSAKSNVPDNASASSVGNDSSEQYSELPEAITRSLAAIGQRADQCEAKLKALQGYAKECAALDQ